MRSLENMLEGKRHLTLVSVRARCNVCEKEYVFFASSSRAQLACPTCQETARRQFKLSSSSDWKSAARRWLDKWLLELAIVSWISDLAGRMN